MTLSVADMVADMEDAADLLADLPALVRDTRQVEGLSYREAAAQIGLGPTHLWNIEQGNQLPGSQTAIAMLRWMARVGRLQTQRMIEESR